MGINRSWYEDIKNTISLTEDCAANGGKWLDDFNECETANEEWCKKSGGQFFECESACRNNPEAQICTLQCVMVCKFPNVNITSFEECAAAGNPIMESYPRQCRINGITFTENIGNELEKSDLIIVDNPRPNQKIISPLIVTGQARGYWFFEASFPVELLDENGMLITQGIATAKDEWMTEEFVPFEAKLEFEKQSVQSGRLLLRKDNPSGLPEYDDVLEMIIKF